jgi:isocitrate dehydrogenase
MSYFSRKWIHQLTNIKKENSMTAKKIDQKRKITVAYGDGIGPEIMEATLNILFAAGAQLELDVIEIGEKAYHKGHSSGIRKEDWQSLLDTGVFLKAPITTPQGGGFKSLNVTVRKTLGMYANIRPCRSFSPFVSTKHPKMDLVIVRENEEDLYAGIEHRQTDEVYQCLKLISRPGCEKIVRYAFEYAKRNGRKKVTCFTKDNIMKMTDGLFHKVFDEISAEYPTLEKEHWIVDIGAAKLADTPEVFDVIVMPNLYGDILSDVTAQIAGSVGMAGSANIGTTCSMFEAIHGSAPRRAGQDLANPSGLLNGAVQMLIHIGQIEVAEKVQNAWLKTIEDGIHTYDIFREGVSKQKVGTKAFAENIINRLGQKPVVLPAVQFIKAETEIKTFETKNKKADKKMVGIDVFLHDDRRDPEFLAGLLKRSELTENFKLQMVTNRGVKVWPEGIKETFCTDHWRCRFISNSDTGAMPWQVFRLLQKVSDQGLDVIKTEHLYNFGEERGYSLGQGQ